MERIDDMLNQLSEATYFTTIGLRSGFHQIRLGKECIPLTAFKTRYGHCEFLVLNFSLTTTQATFMSPMNETCKEQADRFVIVYLDNMIVYSNP